MQQTYQLPNSLEKEDTPFYCELVEKIPKFIRQRLALRLAQSYDKYYTQSGFKEPHNLGTNLIPKGRRAANLSHLYKCEQYAKAIDQCPSWFSEFHEMQYFEIADFAKKLSESNRFTLGQYANQKNLGKVFVNELLSGLGLDIKANSHSAFWLKTTDIPLLRKKLHGNVRREQEELARRLGEVDRVVADQTRTNHKQHQDAKDNFLDSYVIECENESYQMRDVVESFEAGRDAEFYAKIAGLKNLQDMHQHDAMMLTLTAPSSYHAKIKVLSGYSKSGKPNYIMRKNSKYNNKTVKQAYEYIQTTHRKVLKFASKKDLRVAGFTAYQPHQDGTPHAHLFVIGDRADLEKLAEKYEEINLREGAEDAGAVEHRTDVIYEDTEKGRLATYASRYAARDVSEDAWYSTHKIQKLNWFGLPPQNAWRELIRAIDAYNKAKETAENKGWKFNKQIPEQLTEVWYYAEKGDYANFVIALCGGYGFPADLRTRSKGVYKETITKFEELGKKFSHIVINGFALFTHVKKWKITNKKLGKSGVETLVVNYPREQQAVPKAQTKTQKPRKSANLYKDFLADPITKRQAT